ncbi:hypothetical protein IKX64_02600 [Candidatus Saccharibacteria bacterium]|nr:hypothetical protein [Candidatus Saccharibacteria bacterium]
MTRPCIKRLNKLVKFSRKTTMIIIMVCAVLVTVATLVVLFLTPEQRIKGRIESLAHEYYEEYYYGKFTGSVPESNLESLMEKYSEHGFSEVPLRQLLFYDNGKHSDEADEIGHYCDINATSVRIIPDVPYGKTNYHVEYKYSCNF